MNLDAINHRKGNAFARIKFLFSASRILIPFNIV